MATRARNALPSAESISLVVPCFNEAHRLGLTFDGARAVAACAPELVEVLVVDDGSSDGTAALARGLGEGLPLRVIERPHRGKGAAVAAGVLEARGELVFMADADWSMPPEQIQRFTEAMRAGAEVAIGSRELDTSRRFEEPLRRHLVGRAFNGLVRGALLPGLNDTQCGFKMFRREAGRALFASLNTPGWAFDVEILVRARQSGLHITEIPIDWRFQADSRVQVGSDSARMALDIARTWWRVKRSRFG